MFKNVGESILDLVFSPLGAVLVFIVVFLYLILLLSSRDKLKRENDKLYTENEQFELYIKASNNWPDYELISSDLDKITQLSGDIHNVKVPLVKSLISYNKVENKKTEIAQKVVSSENSEDKYKKVKESDEEKTSET